MKHVGIFTGTSIETSARSLAKLSKRGRVIDFDRRDNACDEFEEL